jgi:Fe-S-cluster containining protein
MACKKCGECCKYTAVISGPMDEDAMLWSSYHSHLIIKRGNDKLVIFIPNRCRNLKDDNTCAIYESRPGCCALIPNADCKEFQPPGCRYFDEEM